MNRQASTAAQLSFIGLAIFLIWRIFKFPIQIVIQAYLISMAMNAVLEHMDMAWRVPFKPALITWAVIRVLFVVRRVISVFVEGFREGIEEAKQEAMGKQEEVEVEEEVEEEVTADPTRPQQVRHHPNGTVTYRIGTQDFVEASGVRFRMMYGRAVRLADEMQPGLFTTAADVVYA